MSLKIFSDPMDPSRLLSRPRTTPPTSPPPATELPSSMTHDLARPATLASLPLSPDTPVADPTALARLVPGGGGGGSFDLGAFEPMAPLDPAIIDALLNDQTDRERLTQAQQDLLLTVANYRERLGASGGTGPDAELEKGLNTMYQAVREVADAYYDLTGERRDPRAILGLAMHGGLTPYPADNGGLDGIGPDTPVWSPGSGLAVAHLSVDPSEADKTITDFLNQEDPSIDNAAGHFQTVRTGEGLVVAYRPDAQPPKLWVFGPNGAGGYNAIYRDKTDLSGGLPKSMVLYDGTRIDMATPTAASPTGITVASGGRYTRFSPSVEAPTTQSLTTAVLNQQRLAMQDASIHGELKYKDKVVLAELRRDHPSDDSFWTVTNGPGIHEAAGASAGFNLNAATAMYGAPVTEGTHIPESWQQGLEVDNDPLLKPDHQYYRPTNATLFDGPDVDMPRQVRQGAIGDCYLMATMAELASDDPNLLRDGVRPSINGDPHCYDVRFHRFDARGNPEEVWITVDDQLPSSGAQLPKGQLSGKDVLWPAIVEKAFAVFNDRYGLLTHAQDRDGYQALDQGGWMQVMEAFTGRRASSWLTSGVADESLWSQLQGTTSGRHIIAGTHQDPPSDRVVGLHAYSVVGTTERDGERYVILRNPWGSNPSQGDGTGGYLELPFSEFKESFGQVGII